MTPPCLIFEDDHLLVANKPAGLNTHAPAPYAGEGLYDWLRHREPRWANLAIIHRLDKETSGVIVFSKTSLANRALTAQFTNRMVQKRYLFLSDRRPQRQEFTLTTHLRRAGEKYVSRPLELDQEAAETHFVVLESTPEDSARSHYRVEARPVTGRTHQIRVHAAESNLPILGDILYGGSPAARVYLHAAEVQLCHPVSGELLTFRAPVDFASDARLALREALVEPAATNSYRLVHGASDGFAGWYVDRLGNQLLSQSATELNEPQLAELNLLKQRFCIRSAWHKILRRQVPATTVQEASPQPIAHAFPDSGVHLIPCAAGNNAECAPSNTAGRSTLAPEFVIQENGLQFELSFAEGYSVGLFLDQRDNRRRLLTRHVAAGFPLHEETGVSPIPDVLNVFAYTCAFSVCAAKAGARTTSLDLSKKYLEWGKRNFALNNLDSARHDFIFGDAFDWLGRLRKKRRLFGVILLDPPTFSQSKAGGAFRAGKDYGKLVTAALPLLEPGGVLFAATNAADWPPEDFLATVHQALREAGRNVLNSQYFPQPPDFPISRAEPAYLKTLWLRVG